MLAEGNGFYCRSCLTFPVITRQPSWSMMSTSRGEGGWQNFCCRICRIGSMTFGVSLKATAMCPKARMVWSGIKWASLWGEKEKHPGNSPLWNEAQKLQPGPQGYHSLSDEVVIRQRLPGILTSSRNIKSLALLSMTQIFLCSQTVVQDQHSKVSFTLNGGTDLMHDSTLCK